MNAWRRRFTFGVLAITSALHLPLAVLIAAGLSRELSISAAVILTLPILLMLNAPLLYRMLWRWGDDPAPSRARILLFEGPYFLHFCAMLLFGPLALVVLIALGLGWLFQLSHSWPAIDTVLGPLYLFCFALSLYAGLIRRFWTVVRRIEIRIPDLPRALDGYTIVQLSDVHCGPYTPRWFYRSNAKRASSLGANAIVLTGDMISDGAAYLSDVTDFVRTLSAPDGVYASLGNHDYYGTNEGVPEALERGGARVLRNQGVLIAPERAGGLYLAGVDDTWSRRGNVSASLAERPEGAPCVVLLHDPADFEQLTERKESFLALSGHTHAGQFAVPFFYRKLNLAAIRSKYTAGLYRVASSVLYVHAGNGTSGPPARIGAAPEIACFVLRC
jgi:uncharacterized protein